MERSEHIERAHGDFVVCPHCKVMVRSRHLVRHRGSAKCLINRRENELLGQMWVRLRWTGERGKYARVFFKQVGLLRLEPTTTPMGVSAQEFVRRLQETEEERALTVLRGDPDIATDAWVPRWVYDLYFFGERLHWQHSAYLLPAERRRLLEADHTKAQAIAEHGRALLSEWELMRLNAALPL